MKLSYQGHSLTYPELTGYAGYTESFSGYTRFKLKLTGYAGREYQNPARYVQWDEVGIGYDNNSPVYGPANWTIVSYTLHDATDFGGRDSLPLLMDGYWGDAGGYNSKFDATYDPGCLDTWYGEIIFDSVNGPIIPTSMGFYAPMNIQRHPQTPGKFELYGQANGDWVLLATVNGSQLTLVDHALTVINI